MTTSLLQSSTVSLRPIERTDLPLMYRLENDTTLWETSTAVQPLSRTTIERFISAVTNDIYTDRQLRLVIEEEGKALGFIDLTDFSPRHLRAEVGITLLPEHRGRGIGTEALRLLEQYAAQVLTIHQLYAYAAPDSPSYSLFHSSGYQPAATLRDWVRVKDQYFPMAMLQKVL